jgi:hypothetical protein
MFEIVMIIGLSANTPAGMSHEDVKILYHANEPECISAVAELNAKHETPVMRFECRDSAG